MDNIIDTKENFEIIFPIKRYLQFVFIFGLAGVFTLGIILIFFPALIILGKFNWDMLFGLLPLFGIFNLSMWFIFGHEKLVLKDNTFIYIRSNLIFKRKRIINIEEIRSIEVVSKKNKSDSFFDYYSERMREKQKSIWLSGKLGRLILNTQQKDIYIFSGLNDEECNQVKEAIQKRIKINTSILL